MGIINFPPDPGVEYFIGIDAGGYDDRTYSMCVMGCGVVKVCFSTHDAIDFEQQVKQMAAYYNIPVQNIAYEQK